MHKKILFTLTLCFFIGKLFATTWDEPWADKVIKGATSFVLAKVRSCNAEKGIVIEIIKTLGGKELKDSILINDFYLLTVCSSSGEGVEFHTTEIDSCYFFIYQNAKGKYCIATPTTGFDYVNEGNVMSTFRHSYHQASVPVSIYEKTMTAVFNNYHNLSYDKVFINEFINEYLGKKPAGFSENEIDIFFLQHVALECIYHLKININENLVLPFLNDRNNFHNEVSGARALSAIKTDKSKQALLGIIQDTSYRNFVKVMCIWSLGELDPKELKSKLENLKQTASDKEDGFGGNIMDPRICTHMPTVKEALTELVAKL